MVRWTLLLLLTAGLFYLLLRKVDLQAFGQAIGRADPRLLLLASLIAVTVCMGACALRLWTLLQPLSVHGGGASKWEVTSLYLASSAAHNLLPAPAGEVLRTVQLNRLYGFTVGVLIAAQLVEKVIEALGLGLETALVALLVAVPRAIAVSLYAFAGVGVLGALGVLLVAWRWEQRHATEIPVVPPGPAWSAAVLSGHAQVLLHRLGEGMLRLRAVRLWVWALLWSCVADLGNAVTVGLCLHAVGVALPPMDWFVVVLVTRMAGIVPSTPGQFGVQEAGVVVLLMALGVGQPQALAFALLHHGVHFVPVTLVGLFELRRHWR